LHKDDETSIFQKILDHIVKLEEYWIHSLENIVEQHQKASQTFDKNEKGKPFWVSDTILYWDHRANDLRKKGKWGPKWLGPYQISYSIGQYTYIL